MLNNQKKNIVITYETTWLCSFIEFVFIISSAPLIKYTFVPSTGPLLGKTQVCLNIRVFPSMHSILINN